MKAAPHILLTNLEGLALADVQSALETFPSEVVVASWDLALVDHVHGTAYDLVIIGFPTVGVGLSRLISSLRHRRSACLRCGTILVSAPDRLEEAGRFLGRGVNRVIGEDETTLTLGPTARLLLEVAPRLPLRAPARIMVEVGDRPLRAFCQTENLSRTGMLLRGFGHYPRGTPVEFEISIPGEPTPIRGRAEVLRTTDLTTERVEGVGARFTGFLENDADRLARYLDRHLV